VKEADALSSAGHRVRVVFTQAGLDVNRRHDRSLLDAKSWSAAAVRWARDRSGERYRYLWGTLRQRAGRLLPASAWQWTHTAECLTHRMYPELARCAARESADLYIGHYPAGLAAAAHAAGTHDALLGYDVEDFHVGERPDDEDRIRRIDFIERRYLPECAYVTAASEGIAEAVAERYHVPTPVVVYNTFPKTERSALNGEVNDRDGEALSLYWYSQTIGLDRGIQDAIRAAGRLDVPVQLHVRGSLSDEVRRTLTSLAEESGGAEILYFHEKVPPDELLARAAEHDVGLALEQGHTPNRKICTTNKLFRYMLAGLAIAATDVPGQRTVLGDESAFSGLYPPGDAEALAGILRQWTDRNRLDAAQSAALRAARERWNWETESQKLIDTVNALFD